MSQLDELVARYATAMSEKDRALLEAQIWSMIPKGERPDRGLSEYMRLKFGAQSTHARCRQQLFHAGSIAEPLWPRVEAGMPLHTAVVILRSVKGDRSDGAVMRALESYDKTGYEARLPDGKVVRRKSPSRLREPDGASAPVAHDRTFWRSLRVILGDYVRSRLAGCDPTDADKILRRFEADLNILITEFQGALSSVPKRGIEIAVVSRRSLIAACRTLGMDPPRPGHLVDMKVAKLQKRRHVRVYHPDVHGGSESTRAQYEAVIKAYSILEQYNEMIPVPAPAEPAPQPPETNNDPVAGDTGDQDVQ